MKRLVLCLALIFLVSLTFRPALSPLHAKNHEKQNVKLITATFGSTAYLVAQQLATEVNRSHPWLHINVIEGRPNNVHELANKPNLRKNTFVESATFTKWLVEQGKRPAKAPYHGAKALGSMAGTLSVPIFSRDKNIKSLQDLKGKKVNMFIKGTQGEATLTVLLKHLGIYDSIKRDYLAFNPSVDAMIDGTIDATISYAGLVKRDPRKFSPVAAYIRMLESRKFYVIDIPIDLMRKASKSSGVPITPIRVPAGSIGKGLPYRDITTFATYIYMFVDESFPEHLAYEVCKVFVQHIEALKKTSPVASALALEKMATSNLTPEEYHPGALRFFREKGIKIVTE